MYDPEFEHTLQDIREQCAGTIFEQVAECLEQQYNDYVNCFDPVRKEQLRLEGVQMLKDLESLREDILKDFD